MQSRKIILILTAVIGLSGLARAASADDAVVAPLSNCPGAVIDSGQCEKYSITNAQGDGLTVHETNLQVFSPKVLGASGNGITVSAAGGGVLLQDAIVQNVGENGIVIRGDSCMIDNATINGARGIGLLVIGNRNLITNAKVSNCMRPIVVQGVGNIVNWSDKPQVPIGGTEISPLMQNQNTDVNGSSSTVQGQIRQR